MLLSRQSAMQAESKQQAFGKQQALSGFLRLSALGHGSLLLHVLHRCLLRHVLLRHVLLWLLHDVWRRTDGVTHEFGA